MDAQTLYQSGLSILEVSKRVGKSYRRTYAELKASGIPLRKATDHLAGNSYKARKRIPKKELEELYSQNEKNIREISHVFQCSLKAVHNNLKRHGIARRGFGTKGEKSNWWRGGTSSSEKLFYQSKEWKTLSNECKNRDKCICQKCARQLPGPKLHAHHVTSRRSGGSNELSNLTTLCHSCHRKLHCLESRIHLQSVSL
jgi:hypothetical protein